MQNSPLVLGAMLFGTRIDDDTSFSLLDRFVEAGGEWIDTADCYAFWASDTGFGGDSERLLGRWFAARPGVRDRVKLATKLGAEPTVTDGWPERRQGLSAAAVRDAFAGSLDRLGLDSVDLLWLHQEDRSVPIEETVDAIAEPGGRRSGRQGRRLQSPRVAGGTRESARDGHRLPPDRRVAAQRHLPPPAAGHASPGVVHRFGVLSDEHRDLATENDLEVWAYTPLLSGAYDNPAKPIPDVYDHPGNTARLEALDAAAAELGRQRGQVVLSWLVAHGIRPMLGGSKLEQLELALQGAAFALPPEWLERLDAVDRAEDVAPLIATP